MTLHDVKLLSDYAKTHPPLRVLVHCCAAALGVKFPNPNAPKSKYLTSEEVRALVNASGGRVPGMGGFNG